MLTLLAARLWAGQARYGCLAVRRDGRSFTREALEEVADSALYAAMGLVQRGRGRHA